MGRIEQEALALACPVGAEEHRADSLAPPSGLSGLRRRSKKLRALSPCLRTRVRRSGRSRRSAEADGVLSDDERGWGQGENAQRGVVFAGEVVGRSRKTISAGGGQATGLWRR